MGIDTIRKAMLIDAEQIILLWVSFYNQDRGKRSGSFYLIDIFKLSSCTMIPKVGFNFAVNEDNQ